MLDFICELDRVVGKWPEEANWNLAQIADYTGSGVPQVVDILSDTLDRELEVHECLSKAEVVKVLAVLKDKMQAPLAARARRVEAQRDKAIRAYDITMEKVRVLQSTKNWRSAYKTMGYYVGRHEKDVPEDLLISLYGDCLRLGIKAEANLQELSLWLRKGVATCVKDDRIDGVEDALDFIEAYSDYFVDDNVERGRRLLGSVLGALKDQALGMVTDQAEGSSILPQIDALIKDLRLAIPMSDTY